VATCRRTRISVWLLSLIIAPLLPTAAATADNAGIVSYESQGSPEPDSHVHSLGEYLGDTTLEIPALGIELREERRDLKPGGVAEGLLIVAVVKGSPAESAGLMALQETPKKVLTGVALAGSMVFPPAIILWPVIASLPIGQDGDLIIAVDGSRVTNLADFEAETHEAQAGEIVYLTIVRGGGRVQVPVHIPAIEH
jgi:S1-C subfamily serine protease